jgi:acyl carrier protein
MTEFFSALCALVARVVDPPPQRVEEDTRFEEIGNWSSLTALRLLANVEDRFRVSLDLRDFLAVETVGELADVVRIQRGDTRSTEES